MFGYPGTVIEVASSSSLHAPAAKSRVEARTRSVVINFHGICAVALLLAMASQTALQGENSADLPTSELELKAAFVLNFVRLIKWESVAGEGDNPELSVCALGNSEFGNVVRRVTARKLVGTRSISVKVNLNPDPAHCRVVIVDSAQYPIARQALNAVKNAPVLTIGNGPGLIEMGGMFELIVDGRKVQFDASLEAVRRGGLDVSARLLQLSRNLRKGGNGGL
jgi:hypothetical protein